MAAAKIALDMDLYKKLNADGGQPKTAKQLAEACNVPLDTMSMFQEAPVFRFCPTLPFHRMQKN